MIFSVFDLYFQMLLRIVILSFFKISVFWGIPDLFLFLVILGYVFFSVFWDFSLYKVLRIRFSVF